MTFDTGFTHADESISSDPDQVNLASEVNGMLKRALIGLEDEDFHEADNYCERALKLDPENARAYAIKLCAELGLKKEAELATASPFNHLKNYKRALRFAGTEYRTQLENYAQAALDNAMDVDMYDPMNDIEKALEVAVDKGAVSIDMLQELLGISSSRAGILIDEMGKRNFVEKGKGTESLEVLIDLELLEQLFRRS